VRARRFKPRDAHGSARGWCAITRRSVRDTRVEPARTRRTARDTMEPAMSNHRYERRSLRLTVTRKETLPSGGIRLFFVEDLTDVEFIWTTDSTRAASLSWGSRVVLSSLVRKRSEGRTRHMVRSARFEGRW
jgi:hypothetical protein